MDSDTTEIDLSELTSDFFSSSEGSDALGSDDGHTEGAGESTGTEAQGEAQGSGDDGQQAEAPLDLARLQALAEKRRAERPAAKQEAEKAEVPPPLTAEAIAQAVKGTDSRWAEAQKAYAAGDMLTLSRLMGGEKADAAADFERFTRAALDPDGAKASDRIARLEAELAELKGAGQKIPDEVLTTEKLQAMQREEAQAANRRAFLASFSDSEAFPTLSKVDNESFRLQCGQEAELLITEAGEAPTVELLARIAEQVASSKLGGLLAQNQGAASKTEGGFGNTRATGVAAVGKTEASGEIDNRAASTTSATMPDPDDEEAWERRLEAIARGSRAQ
jgi:hypothetical protein